MQITDLRCNGFTGPLGIDDPAPRLSWRLDAQNPSYRGLRQTAYQITVGVSPGAKDVWDSGMIESDQSLYVPYNGPKLVSRQRVYWQVTVWDENEVPTRSAPDTEPAGTTVGKNDTSHATFVSLSMAVEKRYGSSYPGTASGEGMFRIFKHWSLIDEFAPGKRRTAPAPGCSARCTSGHDDRTH